MKKNRLEAFSDGVIAILITIMVLQLTVPAGPALADLGALAPVLVAYILSFVVIAIYWHNHHHLFQAAQRVNGTVLWANTHLLFWLSLIPFTTAWVGRYGGAGWPVAAYGFDLLCCAIAYTILVRSLVRHHGRDSVLAEAVGSDFKGRVSLLAYLVAMPLAFAAARAAYALYGLVALIWLVPDRRIERVLTRRG